MHNGNEMQLRLITQFEELEALRPAWERLYRQCARRTVFLSHAWFDAAWQWCGMYQELYVLCCERQGDLVGVLPLARHSTARAVAPRQTLEFLAVPDTQRCDLLVADDDVALVAAAFAEELVRRQADWDVLRLRALGDRTLAATTLAEALRIRGLACEVQVATTNPWVALDTEWASYYATRSRRLKKAVNLAANRLARAGRLEVAWLGPDTAEAALAHALDAVIRISSKSWKTRTGNSLDNVGPQAFIRRLTQHAHRNGWLSIWMLTLDKEPVAMEYQLVADGEVYALRSDFDISREELSPGSHLSRCMLEGLFGHGFKRYYMGPGENAYKYRWAESLDPVYSMSVYGRSFRGRALAAWERRLRPALRRVRQHRTDAPNETAEAAGHGGAK
jgi:CelD/BcsL family acetyltransferase involved in cellulose biosynthesis